MKVLKMERITKMKIEVYGEKPEQGKVLRLKLIQVNSEKVELVAVDDEGHTKAFILTIEPDGIRFVYFVPPNIGLPLDDKGRVRLID